VKQVLRIAILSALFLQIAAFAQTKNPVAHLADGSGYLYNGAVASVAPPASVTTKKGTLQVAIKLQDPPLVTKVGANAKQKGITMTAAQQRAYLAQLKTKQDAVVAKVKAMGGVELGRVSKGHNAVIVAIDASKTAALKNLGGVIAVRPLSDFQTTVDTSAVPDLATNLAYLGGDTVHNQGITGAGVRIAMLDSGIDYTHYNLGGSGNVADYNTAKAAATTTPPPSLFPTSKVIGGYDFTGEVWPNGPLAPDPNPLDLNGHGSLTADTAAGRSLDGLHQGIAPDAQVYAVKVCSSVSSSCSGVAMLEGLEFALDPTNSGTLNNAVDVVSMSIGGNFGMREDDVSEMFTEIVNFGVVSVLSAGNSGDIPYIVGHPAATPEVLAVAATNSVVGYGVPLVVNSPPSIAGAYTNTAQVDWAPVTGTTTGDVVYVGRGCPAGSISAGSPADPLLANPAGKIALIDRGSCSVSLKVDYLANNGAIGVILGLVAAGDAVSFSNGGGSNFVPTLVVTQATSNVLKNALTGNTVNATISVNNAISTAGAVASYSSRGPNYSYNMLKPEISAPGTVTGAAVGTGNGLVTEQGTSFACPMTAGTAALLLSQNHSLTPGDIKARLMESTNPVVYQNPLTQPGVLAPLSRVGNGELRINNAAVATTGVWDSSAPLQVALSFGTYRVGANQTLSKKVVVRNYSSISRSYSISNTYVDAPNTTGVTLTFPASITVPANGSASFTLTLKVNAASLPAWTLNGGSKGGTGSTLQTVEYAGYLTLTAGAESVHVPWHILPHQAANVQAASTSVNLGADPTNLTINNTAGVISAPTAVFSLTGTGTQFPASILPAPGSSYAVVNLRAVGVRVVCADAGCTTFAAQFAVNTFGQRSHPDVPAEFDVYIDVDNDGTDDLVIFNADIGQFTTGTMTGQNGVFVADLTTGTAKGPYYYTSADLVSANAILTAPLSALTTSTGLTLNVDTPFTFSVLAFDNYYTGNLTDLISGMKYELDMPQYYALDMSVPPGGAPLTIYPNNAANVYFTGPYNGNSPSQTGLLLMYTHGKTGQEADIVTVSQAPPQ